MIVAPIMIADRLLNPLKRSLAIMAASLPMIDSNPQLAGIKAVMQFKEIGLKLRKTSEWHFPVGKFAKYDALALRNRTATVLGPVPRHARREVAATAIARGDATCDRVAYVRFGGATWRTTG